MATTQKTEREGECRVEPGGFDPPPPVDDEIEDEDVQEVERQRHLPGPRGAGRSPPATERRASRSAAYATSADPSALATYPIVPPNGVTTSSTSDQRVAGT